ncbi:MAG: hypothetical protein U1C74_33870 [Phenylobacterium sp.]|nr:hypothetical protein [Phenylobacterium sp.]
MIQFALFETALGTAGIAWNAAGLVACHLPEHEAEASRRGVQRRFPEASQAAVPAHLEPTVAGIQALMRGEKADLTDAPLDLARTPEFHARVYEIARAIPPGETLTMARSPSDWATGFWRATSVRHWARTPGPSWSLATG